MAAGKFPASPKPNKALESINPAMDTGTAAKPTKPNIPDTTVPSGTANAWIMAANDQIIIDQAYPHFVPKRSTILPANTIEMAYTNWKTDVILA